MFSADFGRALAKPAAAVFSIFFLAGADSLAADPRERYDLDAARIRLQEQHPELAALRAERDAGAAVRKAAGRLIAKNPELELSAIDARRREATPLSPDTPFFHRQSELAGSGWEVGLRQAFETGGQRGLREKVAELEYREKDAALRERRAVLLGELASHYFGYRLQKELNEHLTATFRRLRNTLARLGPGYRDPRLGSYVQNAMRANILHIEAARDRAILARQRHLNWLRRALAIEHGAVPDFADDAPALRRLLDETSLPAFDELLARARQRSPALERARLALGRGKAAESLLARGAYPDLSLFAYAGEDRTGSFAAVGFPGSYESNRYVRFGFSLPLPFFARNQTERLRSRASRAGQEKRLVAYENSLADELRLEYEAFQREAGLSRKLHRNVERAESAELVLIRGLLAGRLSFLEFWAEHDRHHELFLEYIATTLAALQARGRLESLSGFEWNAAEAAR